MSEQVPCTSCGVLILEMTYDTNDGLCMPCKKKMEEDPLDFDFDLDLDFDFEEVELTNPVAKEYQDKGAYVDVHVNDHSKIVLINFESSTVTDFSELSKFSDLMLLNLHGKKFEYSLLSGFLELEILELSNTGIEDISVIKSEKLKTVYLENCLVSDLSPLSKCKVLDEVDIAGAQVTDLSPLYSLPITQLDISRLKIDMSVLKNFKKLEILTTTEFPPAEILSSLKLLSMREELITESQYRKLSEFPDLKLNYDQTIEEIDQVEEDKMEEQERYSDIFNRVYDLGGEVFWGIGKKSVHLNGEEINSLEVISELGTLEELSIYDTSVADLSPLIKLSKLEQISAFDTLIEDLTPLQNLHNLKELFLNSTYVSDLKPLSNLQKLKDLHLEDTRVADLTPLIGLNSLEKLDISYTPVTDITPLRKIPSLKTLYISELNEEYLEILRNLVNITELYFRSITHKLIPQLMNFHHLTHLSFSHSEVPKEIIGGLKDQLPECEISTWDPE